MSARDARSKRSEPASVSSPERSPESQGSSGTRRPPTHEMRTFRGIAVSSGLAIGPVAILNPGGLRLPPREIPPAHVASELARLDVALKAAEAEARLAEASARQRLGAQYADILAVHARMVGDPQLRKQARQRIEDELISAEHAIHDVLNGLITKLAGLSDPHLAARAADVRDILRRILGHFAGSGQRELDPLIEIGEPSVVLAHDLSPSLTASLDRRRVLGFATESGGRTSHTAIVAAGLEIPAVVGVGSFLDAARDSRIAVVDGDDGLLILDPDAATLERYRRESTVREARFAELATQVELPAQTRDGTPVHLMGNIEFPAEVAVCRERGAVGIGLYRTEFLYLGEQRPPTEDEQYAAYETVIRSMAGLPVVIRTLDIGADKLPGDRLGQSVRNPILGLRSIRLSLRETALFKTQLRAILRASILGDVRVMFPMIATLDEFRRARTLLDEVADDLRAEGLAIRSDLPVGAMIEVPAAAMMADHLAKEVDFFSIGTNDLIQYTLAVDRSDETVADLYDAADPAVLRLIARVMEAAKSRDIEVTVCGSMGGEPLYTMLLVGLGLRQLSMPPHQLPEIKRIVRAIDLAVAQTLAADVLCLGTSAEVTARLREELQRAGLGTPAAPEPGS